MYQPICNRDTTTNMSWPILVSEYSLKEASSWKHTAPQKSQKHSSAQQRTRGFHPRGSLWPRRRTEGIGQAERGGFRVDIFVYFRTHVTYMILYAYFSKITQGPWHHLRNWDKTASNIFRTTKQLEIQPARSSFFDNPGTSWFRC